MDSSLVEFYRKFKQQIDPPDIPSGKALKNHDVQVVLEKRFFDLPACEFSAYQAKILRTVVGRIEQAITDPENEGVSDHLMILLATLPQSKSGADLSKTLVSYVPPVRYDEDVPPIEILEAKRIIGSGPNTGLRTWEAALHLARHLHRRPELVKGRRVLELGAGTGFLSIFCAAYLQPETVTTTDGHEEVLTSLRDNVRRNNHHYASSSTPVVQKLFWGDPDDLDRIKNQKFDRIHGIEPGGLGQSGLGQPGLGHMAADPADRAETQVNRSYDIIIGADISYDPDACKALARTLSDLAKSNPYTDILISATQRNLQTLSGFLDECQGSKCGLRVEVVKFEAPRFSDQTGLFHNLVSPIQIFSMWHGHAPLCYSKWLRKRISNGFVTLTAASPPSDNTWASIFDRWREQLSGRPPCIALVVPEDPHNSKSPLHLYPDLEGIAGIVASFVDAFKQNEQAPIALNMDAVQLSIEWSLCNRLQHMLSLKRSGFEADREKIKAGHFRDAWETLLYNLRETRTIVVYPWGRAVLPPAFFSSPRHWVAMDHPQIVFDWTGQLYRQSFQFPIPTNRCRTTNKRLLRILPHEWHKGSLNMGSKAYWTEPTKGALAMVQHSIATTEACFSKMRNTYRPTSRRSRAASIASCAEPENPPWAPPGLPFFARARVIGKRNRSGSWTYGEKPDVVILKEPVY